MKSVHLSKREVGVLFWVSCGLTHPQVGDKVGIEASTVPSHLKNIFKKLKAHCIQVAVLKAVYYGYFTINDWFAAYLTT